MSRTIATVPTTLVALMGVALLVWGLAVAGPARGVTTLAHNSDPLAQSTVIQFRQTEHSASVKSAKVSQGCSMILLARSVFLATPGCVTADGPATAAAQSWGAYALNDDYLQIAPVYETRSDTVVAGSISKRSGAFVGFTWFPDSLTLVPTDAYQP